MIQQVTAPVECLDGPFPFRAQIVHGDFIGAEKEATHYGICRGATRLITEKLAGFTLGGDNFFAAPGLARIIGGPCLVITRLGYRGLFSVGGPIEREGRLRYIDGCTDTLLIAPPRRGDPCLNHLHFPPRIRQTMHTHPSVRIGYVARGCGRAVYPGGEVPLSQGMFWLLPPEAPHCFYTDDLPMDVIAWHPDSDTGPVDDDHPMINRTIVDGVSAREIDAIRTPQAVVGTPAGELTMIDEMM